jgi:hypothetical protein
MPVGDLGSLWSAEAPVVFILVASVAAMMRRVRSSKCGHAGRNFRFKSDTLIMLGKHTARALLVDTFIYLQCLRMSALLFAGPRAMTSFILDRLTPDCLTGIR